MDSAVVISCNSQKVFEAGVRNIYFFIISHAIMYLMQAVLLSNDFSVAFTNIKASLSTVILIFIFSCITMLCKKKTIVGSCALGGINALLAILGSIYLLNTLSRFPRHALSVIFCFGSIYVMTSVLHKEKKMRRICFAIPILLCVGFLAFMYINDFTLVLS